MKLTLHVEDSQLQRLAELVAAEIVKRRVASVAASPNPDQSLRGFASERITYDEAALMAGVKPQTLRAWVSQGKYGFPRPIEIGSRRYLIRSEVEAWLQRRVERTN